MIERYDFNEMLQYGVYYRTNNNTRVIIFIGDSYTLGQGVLRAFKTDNDHIVTNNNNYSHHFSANFRDVDIINVGMGGASNETILDSLYLMKHELKKYDDVMVVFATTSPKRTPLLLDDGSKIELGLSNLNRSEHDVDDIDWMWYERYREAYHVVGARKNHAEHKFGRILVAFQEHCITNGYEWVIFPTFTSDGLYSMFTKPQYYNFFGKHLDKTKVIHFGDGESALGMVKRCAQFNHGNEDYYIGLDTHLSASGYQKMAEMVYDEFKMMDYRKWLQK